MEAEIQKEMAQQIVDTVKDVCGKNINFIDDSGYIIASTDASRIGTFHAIGKQVVRTGTTMEVSDDSEYEGANRGVNFPIVHKEQVIAAIGISGEPEEVRKYAYLAQRIASLLLKERELDALERNRNNRMNYYVRSLIHGRQLPQSHMEEFRKEYGNLEEELYCTVIVRMVSAEKTDNLFHIERMILQVFEKCSPGLYTFEYPNQYILLLGQKDYRKKWTLFRELAKDCGKIVQIGAGSVEKLTEQKRSYETAELALGGLQGEKNIAVYGELDIELLLGSVPEQVKESYREKVLKNLDEEERNVLRVYFEENFSLLKTGARLNLHKNTLQYRLDRIYKRSGYNPRVFHDAVVLYNALKL